MDPIIYPGSLVYRNGSMAIVAVVPTDKPCWVSVKVDVKELEARQFRARMSEILNAL